MRKLAKILLTAGGLSLAAGATATSALADVGFSLNFGTPYYGYYYAPYGYYGYYGYRPHYYYRHHNYYYRHW